MSTPYPLGAKLDKQGCNFSIYAPQCATLKLVLFNPDQTHSTHVIDNVYRGIHHIYIEGIQAGQRYGYLSIVNDEEMILLDPYARALDKAPHYSAPYTAAQSWDFCKAVVTESNFDWQGITKPAIALNQTILFETHVKGFTRLNPQIPEQLQGTYQGLAAPATIAFLKSQGITSVQLMPVAACMHEPHLLEMSKVNYWGYSPLLFMAPDPRYAKQDAVAELKTAIRELHRNGIEVILDVVYNHTAEGGEQGPIFNLKALDEAYYLKTETGFCNYDGCGNSIDMTHQASLSLVMDSLRHWASEYQVDGFRFDLAATLGRNRDRFNTAAGFFQAVAQDPILQQCKLIAEPWDIGPDGYQLGHFPDGWNECNDKYRDTIRSFWRGDQGYLKEFATRIMGSRDLFSAGRWPQKLTVNYITYHDGYTLQDLVSYEQKHNAANGENNRDGHGDNRSYNCGIEGSSADSAVIATREKQKRNFIATLLFSFGIPHLLAADALSHTQGGNNNAYCQDNEISWINWQTDSTKTAFQIWQSAMIAARKQWMLPFIEAFSGQHRHRHRIQWLCYDGQMMTPKDWHEGASVALHLGLDQEGDELLLLFNQDKDATHFVIPDDNDQTWYRFCDTNHDRLSTSAVAADYYLPPLSMAILRRNGTTKI